MAAITVTTIEKAGVPTKPQNTNVPKRSIRGTDAGVYVGPILSAASGALESSISHAVGPMDGGGAEDSTGFRKSDTFQADLNTGGLLGGPSTTLNRPTGGGTRIYYRGDGVQGGSTPGLPAGRSSNGHTTNAFDKRSSVDGAGGRSIGQEGRGSQVLGTTVTFSGGKKGRSVASPGVNATVRRLPQPTTGTTADPAAGTVALVQGALKLQVDLHADDITGGANGRKGCDIALFARDTDTDEDAGKANPLGTRKGTARPIAVVSCDGGTDITDAFTGLAASTTYAWYTRWRALGNAGQVVVGPWSARATVATS